MKDWKDIDKEVQLAFESGEVLRADRATLDGWLVSLTGRTYEYERDQQPMQRRLEVLRHLTAVRLSEESAQRRDAQQARSSESQRRHNNATRWIAVIGIMVSAAAAVLNYLKPPAKPLEQIPVSLAHPVQISAPLSTPAPNPTPAVAVPTAPAIPALKQP